MSNTFTLMTAMPPTKGHLALIKFAAGLGQHTIVIVATQPSEPMVLERYFAVLDAVRNAGMRDVEVRHYNKQLPQDPETSGFWDIWKNIMLVQGMRPGDTFVSSEPYGATMAKVMDSIFIPYDPHRELVHTKATLVRDHTLENFAMMIPEFQEKIRTTVTIFGAESTGKTTLSKELAEFLPAHWLYEWARPYLDLCGPFATYDNMIGIWRGQLAAQRLAQTWEDKAFIVQDTDLFSTIGYWEQPHWQKDLGPVPEGLIADAKANESDLYIITKSNIPFEKDPLRYGGDHRESPDDYWIGVAEKYGLKYRVVEESQLQQRIARATGYIKQAARPRTQMLEYDRGGF